MKLLLLLTSVFILVGCKEPSVPSSEKAPIAIQSEDHGYAETYSSANLETLKNSGKPFAVFVGADWCPGCVMLSKEIQKNQNMLPQDTAILLANFDTETDLKQAYGVTAKHSGIFFDSEGAHVATKTGVYFSDFTNHFLQYN